MGRPRTLAEGYRHRGEADAAGTSPLRGQVALALSGSEEALQVLGSLPARLRHPAVVLAALHDLALAGRAPALAAAHADGDGVAAAAAAVDVLLRRTGDVVAVAARRRPRTDGTGPCAVLYPAVAEAARRAGADAVGLVAVDCAAGLVLQLDRVGLSYGDGRRLGDPSSPVQVSVAVVGPQPVPATVLPEVVERIGVDPDPLDVTDPDDARWLRACLPPDRPEPTARLEAELALAAGAPPLLLRGDAVGSLPDALDRVPAGALPVVTTTWALARLSPARREAFRRGLQEAAAGRAVAWVSVEGVGVAPGVPTLGDRPASGHSTVGVTDGDRCTLRTAVVGRCWSRGRTLSWLGGP